MLEGFGVPISYGRLREACQTGVDGTSIDTLEEVACAIGLAAEQVMLPPDVMTLPEAKALPAIVVVLTPGGATHFVVVWARHGPLLQLMDPGVGRRWVSCERFLREVFRHAMPVAAAAWREWAASGAGLAPLRVRLARVGLAGRRADAVVTRALADPAPWGLARLDAATRLVESLAAGGGLARGSATARVLELFLDRAGRDGPGTPRAEWAIPAGFWSVEPAPADANGGDADEPHVLLRGAVLLTVRGVDEAALAGVVRGEARAPREGEDGEARAVPGEILAALREPPARPLRHLLALLRQDGLLTPALLVAGIVALAVGGVVEALLLRSLFDIGRQLGPGEQRVVALVALVAFLAALLLLELPVTAAQQWLGRHLEVRLRVAFLSKIPRLGDRYLQSRPTSDMADRAHTIQSVRGLPALAAQILRCLAELALTSAGLVWLDPPSTPLVLLAAGLAVALPLAAQPLLLERDLRFRAHGGALMRFYLDALLGLTAVRAHGAERAVRREHEGLLVDWASTGRSMLRVSTATQGVLALASVAVVAGLFFGYLGRAGDTPGALLFLYWALALPATGSEIAGLVAQYPSLRSSLLRLLEPLGAIDEAAGAEGGAPGPAEKRHAKGPRLAFEGVSVVAGGHTLLRDVDLAIAPGEHVAVVGPSGAGKSTLLGLLLGWHRAAAGAVHVDGAPLDGAALDRLRPETAWVDPAVQLWNRTLLDNLTYGTLDGRGAGSAIEAAELHGALEAMPEGLQTRIGEGGTLVSGGEGQRVRLGRAFAREKPRLVLLDEPFRGLDRSARTRLLARARARWAGATMVCVTHDLADAELFDRVIVVEGGAVVEDGAPRDLAAREGARFRALREADRALLTEVWGGSRFRRLRLDHGELIEEGPTP